MNKFFKCFLLLLLLISCSLVSYASTNYHWRWGHWQPVDSGIDQVSRAVIEEIADKTNGRIKIDLFPANQLGDWLEQSEQVMRGSIEIALVPVTTTYDPRLQAYTLPYNLATWENVKQAYLSENPFLYKIMDEAMEDNNMKLLAAIGEGFCGGGFVSIASDVDVLDPFSNKKGMKMRFPPGDPAWENMVKSWGFTPTPVPWNDLYMALQTGLVDCQVGGQPYNTWASFRDVVKYWVQYNNAFQHSFIHMNLDVWNSLSKEDQTIIKEACQKHMLPSFEFAEKEDELYMQKMAEEGIEILIPTAEQNAKIAKATRDYVWPLADEIIGKETMDIIRQFYAE